MPVHPEQARGIRLRNHAQELPAVPLIKGGVLRDQIEGGAAQPGHIRAGVRQQRARHPTAAEALLHPEGAEVGAQIPAELVVE